MSISIKSLAARPVWMKLNPPADIETDISFLVVGEESQEYKQARKSLLTAKPAEYFKDVDSTDVGKMISKIDEVEVDSITLLAACVKDWKGVEEEFSTEMLLSVLNDPALVWIVEQLTDFIKVRSNFFRKS